MYTNKYLIALDLDGTLLTDKKTISIGTKRYLKALEKAGNLIVITTGRPPRSALPFYKRLNLKSPMICYNGAYCYNPSDENFLPIKHLVSKDSLKEIYKNFIKDHIDSVMAENLSNLYIDKEDCFLFTFYDNNNLTIKKGDISENLDQDVFTFVMHTEDKSEENINFVKDYVSNNYDKIEVHFWGHNNYCEIQNKGVNKAATVRKLLSLYGIDENHCITFGDSMNDIELITEFKNGYVLRNGIKYVKNIAPNQTNFDNNHNGVKRQLETIINKNH